MKKLFLSVKKWSMPLLALTAAVLSGTVLTLLISAGIAAVQNIAPRDYMIKGVFTESGAYSGDPESFMPDLLEALDESGYVESDRLAGASGYSPGILKAYDTSTYPASVSIVTAVYKGEIQLPRQFGYSMDMYVFSLETIIAQGSGVPQTELIVAPKEKFTSIATPAENNSYIIVGHFVDTIEDDSRLNSPMSVLNPSHVRYIGSDGVSGLEYDYYMNLFQNIIEISEIASQTIEVIGADGPEDVYDFYSEANITSGRGFSDSERATGAAVCLVNAPLAEANGYSPGDTLTLHISSEGYERIPFFIDDEEQLYVWRVNSCASYAELPGPAEYEIAGIYDAGMAEGESLPSLNSVIIPANTLPEGAKASNGPVPPYLYSIKAPSSRTDELLKLLESRGLGGALAFPLPPGLTAVTVSDMRAAALSELLMPALLCLAAALTLLMCYLFILKRDADRILDADGRQKAALSLCKKSLIIILLSFAICFALCSILYDSASGLVDNLLSSPSSGPAQYGDGPTVIFIHGDDTFAEDGMTGRGPVLPVLICFHAVLLISSLMLAATVGKGGGSGAVEAQLYDDSGGTWQ